MGTAVAQAEHGARVDEHVVQRPEVAVGVAEQGDVEQAPAVVGHHQVVGDLLGGRPRARRRPARCGRRGLVLGRVAEREQLVPGRGEERRDAADLGPLGHHGGPHVGVAQAGHPLLAGQAGDGLPGLVEQERVRRRVPAEQHRRGRPPPGGRCAPSAAVASSASSISRRQCSGRTSSCRQLKVTGRPVSRAMVAIQANSDSGLIMSLASSNTPEPASPSAMPMPISSSALAVVPAASSPSLARCRIVRVVEKPTAPASTASRDDLGHALDLVGGGLGVLAAAGRP